MSFKDACILRSWNDKEADEIDIIVNKHVFKELKDNLTIFRFYDTYHHFFPKGDRIIDLHIHLNQLSWNYIPYLKWDKKCIKYKKIKIPEESWYIAELILHSIVDNKYFKKSYIKDIEKFDKWNKLEKIISENLGLKLSKNIVFLTKNKKYDDLLKLRWKIVQAGALRNPLTLPKAVLAVLDKKLFSKFRLRRAPLFVFVGPDGSGKTTLVNKTKELIDRLGRKVTTCRLGIYNQRTWPLRKIARNTKIRAPTILKTFVRFFDMWIRYLTFEFRRLKGITIISDRYFYDLAFYSPGIVSNLLSKISPKPSVAFLVYTNPKTLVKRRQEQEEKELETNLKSMMKMADTFRLVKIDNKEMKKSMDIVKTQIFDNENFLKLFRPTP